MFYNGLKIENLVKVTHTRHEFQAKTKLIPPNYRVLDKVSADTIYIDILHTSSTTIRDTGFSITRCATSLALESFTEQFYTIAGDAEYPTAIFLSDHSSEVLLDLFGKSDVFL